MTAIEQAIKKIVKEMLIKHKGNRRNAAAELGISRKSVGNYINKWSELKEFVVNKSKWPDNKMTRRHHDREEN